MKFTKQELQTRWSETSALPIVSMERPRSPFGVTETGLVDFRGFGYPLSDDFGKCSVFCVQQQKLNNLEFSNCDFSFCSFSHTTLENCRFQNCVFVGSSLTFANLDGCSMIQCSFRSAKFQGAQIGATYRHPETLFESVIFERCNFARTAFFAPFFRRCTFDHCSKSLDFQASSFEDTSFSGRYSSLWFSNGWPFKEDERFGVARPNLMKNVSFLASEVESFTFTHQCPLHDVILPQKGRYLHLCRFHQCLQDIQSEADKQIDRVKRELLYFIEFYNRRAGQTGDFPEYTTQEEYLISVDGLEQKYAPATVAVLVRVFQSYQKAPLDQ